MKNTIWLLQFRTRHRKNGKWSPWELMRGDETSQTAFTAYPSHEIRNEERYQRRAVTYDIHHEEDEEPQ